jgi:hypothetical protein
VRRVGQLTSVEAQRSLVGVRSQRFRATQTCRRLSGQVPRRVVSGPRPVRGSRQRAEPSGRGTAAPSNDLTVQWTDPPGILPPGADGGVPRALAVAPFPRPRPLPAPRGLRARNGGGDLTPGRCSISLFCPRYRGGGHGAD